MRTSMRTPKPTQAISYSQRPRMWSAMSSFGLSISAAQTRSLTDREISILVRLLLQSAAEAERNERVLVS